MKSASRSMSLVASCALVLFFVIGPSVVTATPYVGISADISSGMPGWVDVSGAVNRLAEPLQMAPRRGADDFPTARQVAAFFCDVSAESEPDESDRDDSSLPPSRDLTNCARLSRAVQANLFVAASAPIEAPDSRGPPNA